MNKLHIPSRFKDWVDLYFDAFKGINSLKKYMQQVHENTERYLANLSADVLRNEIAVPWSDKPSTRMTVDTPLTCIVIEDMINLRRVVSGAMAEGFRGALHGLLTLQTGTSELAKVYSFNFALFICRF